VIVVSNASPICYLTLIDCLDLLPQLFVRTIIPRSVLRELRHRKAPAAVRELALAIPPWLEVRTSRTRSRDLRLQQGERDAIALAEHLHADLILLDDAAARRVAAARGLRVTGLLGVLVEGATRGLVDLPDALDRLRQTNFRASPELLKTVLERAKPPSG